MTSISEKEYQFAIIGCGRIAHRHASHVGKFGRLVAVCDVHEESAKKLGEEYGARPYVNIDDMLATEKTVDVVSVCSPNGFHARHTIQALNAGYHVLCEKPMAISVGDCGEMIKAAERANRRLFIVKQNRFNPPVQRVKEMIEDGKLGRILSFQLSCFWNRNEQYYKDSWKGTKSIDGGTLYTLFSHFIALLYWMIGDVEEVKAVVGNLAHGDMIEIEDTGAVILKFYNGAVGTMNYTTNAYGGNMEGSLTLFGEKGTVKIGGQYLNDLEYVNVEGIDSDGSGASASSYLKYEGTQAHVDKVYENIVQVLNGAGVIATAGFEGMKTVEIIDRIYRAHLK
jgi:UDP-N-acetyl-2-amino-2-deoxyglucuronate dehydrogenase